MDWKDYRVDPDEGLLEKIERRVQRRRAWRVGGIVAGILALTVAAGMLLPKGNVAEDNMASNAVNTGMQPSVQGTQAIRPPYGERRRPAGTSDLPTGNAGVSPACPNSAQGTQASRLHVPTTNGERRHPAGTYDLPMGNAGDPTSVQGMQAFQTGNAGVAPADEKMPSLPPSEVWRDTVDVADLLQEVPEDGAAAIATPAAKEGEPEEVPPHYDNVLWAPNAMAPHSDNADDHLFKVRSTSPVSHFRLIIYNRGGRQVFTTDDINHSWDGTHDGTPVPQGTYVWVARFRDSAGTLRQEKGTVTVIL